MKKMKYLIGALGCLILMGNAASAHAEEMASAAENNGSILTSNYIGQRSSAVALHFKVNEKGAGADSAIILMETLKRKLAEQGFERQHSEDAWQNAVHGYSVYIIPDAGYSEESRSLVKRKGHLTALIVEDENAAAVIAAPATGSVMEYRQIEKMADQIIMLLVFHSFI